MVLDQHSLGGGSLPPAELKPEPAPSPALPPDPKNIPDRIFSLIPSKNCGLNPTPAEPPLAEQPPRQERIRSCKLRCGWEVFALPLCCVFFSARGTTGCAGLAAPEPFAAGRGFFCACAVTEVNQPSSPLPLPLPSVLLVNQKKFGWLPGKHLLKSDLLLQQP